MRQKTFRFIDLFAGIGGMRIPFENAGGACVFTSEIDPVCAKSYEANFGDKPFGDITLIPPEDVPDHDILLGGFPCQAFSIIGARKGFADTRGTLFFNIERILAVKKPKAFLLENVKQLKTHDNGRTYRVIADTLNRLGYHVETRVLNSLDFGTPQKRERVYIVGFHEKDPGFAFPEGGAEYCLESLLTPAVPEKYFAARRIVAKRKAALKTPPPFPSVWHENKSGAVSALPYSCALRSSASHNYLLVNGERRFTERELFRLQGFPESYKIITNYSQAKRQTGNAVTVPVIQAIAERVLEGV